MRTQSALHLEKESVAWNPNFFCGNFMPDAVSELEQWVGEHGDALFCYARYRVDAPNVAADLV